MKAKTTADNTGSHVKQFLRAQKIFLIHLGFKVGSSKFKVEN
jgi:hypothetical protein